MIALAHMTESLTYYKRLKIMEAEGEIYEIMRKIDTTTSGKDELYKQLIDAEEELKEAKAGLAERLEKMDDIPVLEIIGD
jgi:uncharacterized membrane protein